jgi:hypothetical protein
MIEKKLAENLDLLRDRIEIGKASVIIIDGGVGEGKTTLAVQCADYYQGKPIDFKKQLAMGAEQFNEKLIQCFNEKLPVLIYDEAGDFSKRGALTKLNSMVNRIFETFRTFRILIILVLPNFNMLDRALFDNQIPRLLLHCHKRSRVEGRFKGYSLTQMSYIKEKMKDVIIKSNAYKFGNPNFRGKFSNLEPLRAIELDKFTTNQKTMIINKQSMIMLNLVDMNSMALTLGRSKDWVKRKISKLKIKEERTYKTKKYFNKEIIERLKDELAD